MRSIARTVLTVVAAAAAVMCLPQETGLAARVDVTGSSWEGDGRLGARIPRAGRASGPVSCTFHLGPNGGLRADRFRLSIDDGVDIVGVEGTYTVDARKRVRFVPDEAALLATWEFLFAAYASGQGIDVDDLDISIRNAKVGMKARSRRDGTEVFKARHGVTLRAEYRRGSRVRRVRTRIFFRARGTRASR